MKYDFSLDINNENSLSIILKQIQPNSNVLEFGPAMGRMTKYLKEVLKCNVSIVELDGEGYSNTIKYAVDGFLGNAEELLWADKFKESRFDYIIFADVIEHLKNPDEVVTAARNLLANDGKIILSVPNVAHNSVIIDLVNNKFNYSKVGLLDNTHIKFFTYHSLIHMLNCCNLVVCKELATYAQAYETELQNNYDMITSELANILKSRNYGDVYQFVFTCMKKEDLNKENISITRNIKRITPNETIKIYLNDGSGLDEHNVLMKYIYPGSNKVMFNLDCNYHINQLRIDISEETCFIKINEMKLDDQYFEVSDLVGNYSYKENNIYIFTNRDSNIYINDITDKCKVLSIDFELTYLYDNVLLNNYLATKEDRVNKLTLENKSLTAKLDDKKVECVVQKQELNNKIAEKDIIIDKLQQELKENSSIMSNLEEEIKNKIDVIDRLSKEVSVLNKSLFHKILNKRSYKDDKLRG